MIPTTDLAGKCTVQDLGSGVDVVAWSAVMSACDKGGEYLGQARGSVRTGSHVLEWTRHTMKP